MRSLPKFSEPDHKDSEGHRGESHHAVPSVLAARPLEPALHWAAACTGGGVRAEFGSEESDLLRNRDTHREPFIPIIQPLLWPPGCPALTSCTKAAGTVPSLLCQRGEFEMSQELC